MGKLDDKSPLQKVGEQLMQIERDTLDAFKNKRERDFTAWFSPDYIGVANEGMRSRDGEVQGMNSLNLHRLDMVDEAIKFPADNVAVLTYKMIVAGERDRAPVNGTINTSSVYVRDGDQWKIVLHTESMLPS